ncbi:MAG TPA: helix-turn-helix transcriptional regulator [Streptosporangiaceae bacterium]|nr:helix-turn-helix transcriptional regulator [Streptosporangiaceae bacterium]
MAGSKEAGPAARLVAANLRRIRQEQGLSYAELARRLAAIGHPVGDTALLKTEKGDRRASVDDLVAFAIALGTAPGRLLLPPMDIDHLADEYELTPQVKETPPLLHAWAAGEVPLGSLPVSARSDRAARGAEVVFSRENRPHHWNAPAPAVPEPGEAAARVFAVTGIAAFIQEAFISGLSTADIRAAVEGALATALLIPDPASASVRIEVDEGRVTVWTGPPDSPGSPEAQEEQ